MNLFQYKKIKDGLKYRSCLKLIIKQLRSDKKVSDCIEEMLMEELEYLRIELKKRDKLIEEMECESNELNVEIRKLRALIEGEEKRLLKSNSNV